MVRDPAMLACREVVELMTELLSAALSPEDRVRIEQHLLVCPPCTLHLGQMKSTIALTRELRGGTGDRADAAGLPAAVMALFQRWKADERAR